MFSGWWSAFIGIPYVDQGVLRAGADCWGLVKLVMKEVYQIDLSDFAPERPSSLDLKPNHDLVRAISKSDAWREDWEEVKTPQEGDIVVIKVYGFAAHVGVMIDDKRYLHTRGKSNSCIGSISDKWTLKKVDSYWRHKPKQ